MWGFTPDESEPYIDYCTKEVAIREAIHNLFSGRKSLGNTKQRPLSVEDKYCEVCRAAAKRFGNKVECSTCDRNIQVIRDAERREDPVSHRSY